MSDSSFPKRPGAEQRRLEASRRAGSRWKQWGPYLSERAWGTVREDYSLDGDAWAHFPHAQARSRAYRWNEDGLAGFSDADQYLCLSLALWNGRDSLLKERLFGLAGEEGNHGEDVKELYWYIDSTPTHSFCEMVYRYPHAAFPYEDLVATNATRGYDEPEYELTDTGIFDDDRFHDVTVRYAKASEDDLLIQIEVENHAAEAADLSVVPQLWFRNTWSWGHPEGPRGDVPTRPVLRQTDEHTITADHPVLGTYHWYWQGTPDTLFTDNDTNRHVTEGLPNHSPYVKDGFHRAIVDGDDSAVNPAAEGTKAGLHYRLRIPAGGTGRLQLRLSATSRTHPFRGFKPVIDRRRRDADLFYATVQDDRLDERMRCVQRQALAGMLWSKQFFYCNVAQWYPGHPGNPVKRELARNERWQHLDAHDILSMPDAWEYPWFAVWDTAFHCLPLAMVDVEFAKQQLQLMTLDRYQHPNGQLPAYEYAFDDVNPPVHAWAVLEVYRMEQAQHDRSDRVFLESCFHKLVLNFAWWINRKDDNDDGVFAGGFLGLDNISVFDRSLEPPDGGELDQSDSTAWMGFFALRMMQIALELAKRNPAYESLAIQFLEHHQRIATALHGNAMHPGLWDPVDGFYYDTLHMPSGERRVLKVRSLTGLMPLIASLSVDPDGYRALPDFSERLRSIVEDAATGDDATTNDGNLLCAVAGPKLASVLRYMLDEREFLSPHGIRSLSRYHANAPWHLAVAGEPALTIGYEPAEGESDMFGGNSNWRGPVWFPMNYVLIEALREYHRAHGDQLTVEYPTGSGRHITLGAVADALADRLIDLFAEHRDSPTPWCGDDAVLELACRNRRRHLFFEYFHGENGTGLGASHQTGWTGLVALLIQQRAGAR